jgi:atypical dual specificity phosphatase
MTNFFSRLTNKSSSSAGARQTSQKLNWILPGELAVGPIPSDQARQSLLLSSGIRSILTLCSETEGTPPPNLINQLSWSRIPLPDSHSDSPIEASELARAVDQTQAYIQSAAPLYIHCVAGIERSPSVCVGYLYKYKSMPLWEALNWVKQANPRTNILQSQLQAIHSLLP